MEYFFKTYDTTQALRLEMIGIQNLHPLLKNMSKHHLTSTKWKALSKTCDRGKALLSVYSRLLGRKKSFVSSDSAASSFVSEIPLSIDQDSLLQMRQVLPLSSPKSICLSSLLNFSASLSNMEN